MNNFFRLFFIFCLICGPVSFLSAGEEAHAAEEPIPVHDEQYYEQATVEERDQMQRDLQKQADDAWVAEDNAKEAASEAQAVIDDSSNNPQVQQTAQVQKQQADQEAQAAADRKNAAQSQLRIIEQVNIRIQQAAAEIASAHQKALDDQVIQVLTDVQSFNDQTSDTDRASAKNKLEVLLDMDMTEMDAQLTSEQRTELQSAYFDTFVAPTISQSNDTLGTLFNNQDLSVIVETQPIGSLAQAMSDYGVLQDSLSHSLSFISADQVQSVQTAMVKLKSGIDVIQVNVMGRVQDFISFVENPQQPSQTSILGSLTDAISDFLNKNSTQEKLYTDLRNAVVKMYGLHIDTMGNVSAPTNASHPLIDFYQQGLDIITALENGKNDDGTVQTAIQRMHEKFLDDRILVKNQLSAEIAELTQDVSALGGKGVDPLADRLLIDLDRAEDANNAVLASDSAQAVAHASVETTSKNVTDVLQAVKAQLAPGSNAFSAASTNLAQARVAVDSALGRVDAVILALEDRQALLKSYQKRFGESSPWYAKAETELVDVQAKIAEATSDRVALTQKQIQIAGASAGVESGMAKIISDYQQSPRTTILAQVKGFFSDALNFVKQAFTSLKLAFTGGDATAGTLSDQITQMNQSVSALGSKIGATQTTITNLIGNNVSGGSNGALYDAITTLLGQDPQTPPTDPLGKRKYNQTMRLNDLNQAIAATEAVQQEFLTQFSVVDTLRGALSRSRAIMEVSTSMQGKTFDGKDLSQAGPYFVVPTAPTADDILYIGQHVLLGDSGSSDTTYTVVQYTQEGQAVFEQMQGKSFNQLPFDNARSLIEMYRRREAEKVGGSKSDTLEALRDLGHLMDAGGPLVWEQVKDIMAGKPDFAQLSKNDSDYAQDVSALFGSGTTSLTMQVSLLYATMAPQKVYLEGSLQELYQLRSSIDSDYQDPIMANYPNDDN